MNFPVKEISSISDFGFNIYPTNIHVRKAVIGISTLLLTKSKKSRNERFIIVISLQRPNPNDDGRPKIIHPINTNMHVSLLSSLNLSQNTDTTVSIREIDEVRAAKRTNTKNSKPKISPPNISPNTLGYVWNISPGPHLSIAPTPSKATTAGTIINPAMKAIPVSNNSICLTLPSRLTSFFI